MRRAAAIAVVLHALAAPGAHAQENYQRYQRLPEQRQKELLQRHQQFREMPPQERERLRQNYHTYQRFDPRQRQEFLEKYHRWKGRK